MAWRDPTAIRHRSAPVFPSRPSGAALLGAVGGGSDSLRGHITAAAMISKALNAKSGILLIAALATSAIVGRDPACPMGLPGDAARRSPKLWDSAQTDSCASSTPPAIAACLRAISQRWHAAPSAVSCPVRAVRGARAGLRSRRDLGATVDLRADSLFSSATEDGHPVTGTFGGGLALHHVVAGSPG